MPQEALLLIYVCQAGSGWMCSNLPGIPVHIDHINTLALDIDAPASLLCQLSEDLASIEFKNALGE